MAAYTLLVQADLSGTAFGAAPTWTDITPCARLVDGINITSWRQDALASISPSTLAIVLDNSDLASFGAAPNAGRFTPGLSTSPWSGKILPGVRFRVSVTVNATTYTLYDGYATDWSAAYNDDGSFSTCTVNCTDILGWMGQIYLRSLLQEEILQDAPTIYLPLTDPAGSLAPAAVVAPNGAAPLMVRSKYGGGSFAFAGAPSPAAEGAQALVLTQASATQGYVVDFPITSGITVAGATGVLAIRVVWAGTATSGHLLMLRNPGTGSYFGLQLDGTGKVQGVGSVASGGGAATSLGTVTSAAAINDGKLHDIVYVYDGTNALSKEILTVDAGAPAGANNAFTGNLILNDLQVGGRIDGVVTGSLTSGTYCHAAVYVNVTPTAADHYHAGADGFAGERTDTHATRLLSYRANAGSVLDVGKGTVGVHNTAGATEQQALLDTGKAEGGVLYADGQGRIVLLNRVHLYDPASAASFDAEADLFADYVARIDTQQLLNDVTVGRPNGANQRVQSTTSQTSFGARVLSDTLILNSDRDASDAAGWTVANDKTPAVRTPNVSVDILTTSLAQAQAALARAPLDRIAVTNLPGSAPPTDVMIQGRSIRITNLEFTVSFFTSVLPRKTLRTDASASANTKLDNGLVVPW